MASVLSDTSLLQGAATEKLTQSHPRRPDETVHGYAGSNCCNGVSRKEYAAMRNMGDSLNVLDDNLILSSALSQTCPRGAKTNMPSGW